MGIVNVSIWSVLRRERVTAIGRLQSTVLVILWHPLLVGRTLCQPFVLASLAHVEILFQLFALLEPRSRKGPGFLGPFPAAMLLNFADVRGREGQSSARAV